MLIESLIEHYTRKRIWLHHVKNVFSEILLVNNHLPDERGRIWRIWIQHLDMWVFLLMVI